MAQLNKSDKTIVICKRGPRSYQAAHILRNAGFEEVYILAGGISAVYKSEEILSGVSI